VPRPEFHFLKVGNPTAILDFDTGQKCVTARCWLSMTTTLPNFVTVRQLAADLLLFVEKFKMVASAIFNLYLAILDHPRSSIVALKSHRKVGVNRTFTFQDMAIFKILKIWLKAPIQAPKIYVFGG